MAGLELGPASVKALAIKSKVKRTTIYQLLDDLKVRGLFKESLRKKKLLYVAAHPNQLKVMLNDQSEVLNRNFEALLTVTNSDLGRPAVELYDTVDGVRKMYEDALGEVATDTIGIAGDEAVVGLDEVWLQKYIHKRQKAGLEAKTIMTDSKLAKKWKKDDCSHSRETKLLAGYEQVPVNIEVVGDRVLISSLKGETLGVVIKSSRIASGFRIILSELWKKLD